MHTCDIWPIITKWVLRQGEESPPTLGVLGLVGLPASSVFVYWRWMPRRQLFLLLKNSLDWEMINSSTHRAESWWKSHRDLEKKREPRSLNTNAGRDKKEKEKRKMREGGRGAGGGEGTGGRRVLREVTQGTRKEMKEMRVRGTPGRKWVSVSWKDLPSCGAEHSCKNQTET